MTGWLKMVPGSCQRRRAGDRTAWVAWVWVLCLLNQTPTPDFSCSRSAHSSLSHFPPTRAHPLQPLSWAARSAWLPSAARCKSAAPSDPTSHPSQVRSSSSRQQAERPASRGRRWQPAAAVQRQRQPAAVVGCIVCPSGPAADHAPTLALPCPAGVTPGYGSEVIFADGTFIDGSTAELSADGPIRAPYVVYCQVGDRTAAVLAHTRCMCTAAAALHRPHPGRRLRSARCCRCCFGTPPRCWGALLWRCTAAGRHPLDPLGLCARVLHCRNEGGR